MRETFSWMRLLMISLLAATLMLGGCGDDGKDGKDGFTPIKNVDYFDGNDGNDGKDGNDGAPGRDGATVLANAHEMTNVVSFSATSAEAEGDALVVRFNLKVDGVNNNNYTEVNRVVVMYKDGDVYKRQAFDRQAANYAITQTVSSGNYTVRISRTEAAVEAGLPSPGSFVGQDARYYVRMRGGPRNASISFEDAAYARVDLTSNAACIACHGDQGVSFGHHTYPFRAEACITCHAPVNNVSASKVLMSNSLGEIVHGIHNSYNMPDNTYVYDKTTSGKSDLPHLHDQLFRVS